MIKKLFLLASLLLCMCLVTLNAQKPAEKHNLRVLYVGGTAEMYEDTFGDDTAAKEKSVKERMKAFEQMLNDYFTSVTVMHADDYTQDLSSKYDVTVMDGRPKPIVPRYQDAAKGIYLSAGYLTEDFDRPMLTIGEVGEAIGRRIGLKNDWYCLCLDADAHHWRPEHAIFKGPFAVKMTVADKPTPEDAFHYAYYYDGTLPATIPMWTVQTKGYMTHPGFRVGMVARPWGYEDSPEAEYISSGVCAKTLDAVAIGRHGNFFHWGFAASPAYMTEEAKPVLANAIVYIAQFAGQTPIARKYNDRIATREYLKELKHLSTRESYDERQVSNAKWEQEMLQRQQEAVAKKARGEKLTPNETSMLTFEAPAAQSFEEYVKRYQKDFFHLFGTDSKAYREFYDANRDYFYGEGFYHLEVDEDAKSLGIPNYDKRILDEAIKLLETGKDTEKGKRILARYTLMDFATPAQWREWYDTNKARLFWTEAGGWLYLVDTREPGMNDYKARELRRAAAEIEAGPTDDRNPVAVKTEVITLHDGNKMVCVKISIHDGYHIYGRVGNGDPYIPTVVEMTPPPAYTAMGGMKVPAQRYFNDKGTTIFEDTVVFSRELTGVGAGQLKCTVSYQCCDAHVCMPPVTEEFVIEL